MVVSPLAFLQASSCAGSDLIGFMCGNVFQSHTCEIPPHLLAISSGHNTQQREESPQRLDSLDCGSAFIAVEENGSLQRFTASAALSLSVFFLSCSPFQSFFLQSFNPSILSLSLCLNSHIFYFMSQVFNLALEVVFLSGAVFLSLQVVLFPFQPQHFSTLVTSFSS